MCVLSSDLLDAHSTPFGMSWGASPGISHTEGRPIKYEIFFFSTAKRDYTYFLFSVKACPVVKLVDLN